MRNYLILLIILCHSINSVSQINYFETIDIVYTSNDTLKKTIGFQDNQLYFAHGKELYRIINDTIEFVYSDNTYNIKCFSNIFVLSRPLDTFYHIASFDTLLQKFKHIYLIDKDSISYSYENYQTFAYNGDSLLAYWPNNGKIKLLSTNSGRKINSYGGYNSGSYRVSKIKFYNDSLYTYEQSSSGLSSDKIVAYSLSGNKQELLLNWYGIDNDFDIVDEKLISTYEYPWDKFQITISDLNYNIIDSINTADIHYKKVYGVIKNNSITILLLSFTDTSNNVLLKIITENNETSSHNYTSTNNMEIDIFPNPAFDILTVKTPYSAKRIDFYNALGDKIILNSEGIADNEIQVNVSILPKGLYIIRVHTENKHISKKLIIN